MAAPATITAPDGGHPSPRNSNNSDRTTDEDREFNKNAIFDPAAEPPPAKRPRGRPPGSKNKPKPPVCVALDANDAFRSHIMEVAPGADVAASLVAYVRAHRCGVAVLHATGSVAGSVSFRHIAPFKGQYDIVSLRGTIFPDNNAAQSLSALTLFISSGPTVIGGVVNGPLIAAAPVMVTAATFSPTAIEKLPPMDAPVESTDHSDPDPGPTNAPIEGPVTGPGSGFNPGFNIMNLGMANWRQEGLQYGWPPHQQQQQNGRRYLNN